MILLFIASLITAGISSLTGMAGGVVLLSLMTLSLPLKVIIPIHGMVQLFSNGLRVFYLKNNLNFNFLKYFILGIPLGAALALLILRKLTDDRWLLIMLAMLVSYSIFKPKKLPQLKIPVYAWSMVGFVAGVLALLIGSVGPFLAVFFVRDDLTKEQIVVTKASMQLCCHIIKIPSFLYIGFNYKQHTAIIVIMVIGALVGTKIGVILLRKINNKAFKLLFKSFLFIALIRLVYKIYILKP